MRNTPYIAAGTICLLTALLHTIGGQIELVNPLLDTDLTLQVRSELLGAWHLVTVILYVFGFLLLREGLRMRPTNISLIHTIAIVNFLFALVFLTICAVQWVHTPQYILFLPIGGLTFLGMKKHKTVSN